MKYERDAQTMLAPPSPMKVHPLGKSPVITDGELTVAEAGAIVEYLIDRYGNRRLVSPPGTPQRLRWTYWLHFAEGSAMPPLLLKLIFERIKVAPMPFFAKPIARGIANKVPAAMVEPNLKRQLDFMEGELGRGEWFAGAQFSAADIPSQLIFSTDAEAENLASTATAKAARRTWIDSGCRTTLGHVAAYRAARHHGRLSGTAMRRIRHLRRGICPLANVLLRAHARARDTAGHARCLQHANPRRPAGARRRPSTRSTRCRNFASRSSACRPNSSSRRPGTRH